MDKISIIMPAYNAAKFIGESIDSVLKQTYDNWELVIVNDGSLDNTWNIIKKYKEQYCKKIKIINKEQNSGTANTLNLAADNTIGKYLCWLSADDLYEKDMLEKSLRFLYTHTEYDAVFSLCDYIDEKSLFIENWNPVSLIKEYRGRVKYQPYRSMITQCNSFYGCSLLTKREIWIKTGNLNPKYRYAHDYDFWLRMSAIANMGYMDKITVHGRVYNEQITQQGHNEIDAINVFFDLLDKPDIIKKIFEKAQMEYNIDSEIDCIEQRLKMYRKQELELKQIYIRVKELIEKNNKFELIYYEALYIINDEKLPNNFFDFTSKDGYLSWMCKETNVDGIMINSQGIRFDRYSNGNGCKRVADAFERYNQAVQCRIKAKDFENIKDILQSDLLYYIIEKKEEYVILISEYMLKDDKYKIYFDKCEKKLLKRSLWNIVFSAIVKQTNILG